MMTFKMTSPYEILKGVGGRLKQRRIAAKLTQRELASKSGVSYSSIRKLEATGEGAFEALVKIAFVLDGEAEFEKLFPAPIATTLEEWIDKPQKQRVRKK